MGQGKLRNSPPAADTADYRTARLAFDGPSSYTRQYRADKGSRNYSGLLLGEQDESTIPFDRLFVEVRSASGAPLGTMTTFSNLNKVAASNLYTLRGNYSLLAYAGQTVRLQFHAQAIRIIGSVSLPVSLLRI